MDESIERLARLTDAPGPSGFEQPVKALMRKYLSDVCSLDTDKLGSLIALKTGQESGPKVMLAAHMDEVGFLVTRVTDSGYLKFTELGGWWPSRLLGHTVSVLGPQGPLPGLIDCRSEHQMTEEERRKPLTIEGLFIDVGARNAEQVASWGIRPGTPAVPATHFTRMTDDTFLLAKAWDDRAGCAAAVDIMLNLSKSRHPNAVYAVGTAMEEEGARGARTAGHAIKPDVGLILEVGVAADMPGSDGDDTVPVALGKGPVVTVYDASMLPNQPLLELVLSTAEAESIPVQYGIVARGGTDGSRIHVLGTGVPCLVLGVPARYLHSMAGLIHRQDYEALVRLATAVVERLDTKTVGSLTAV
jgi:putative aminopeptidase FrvX